MDKALQKVAEFNNQDQYAVQWIQAELERIQQMPGASRLFRRIASASDKEQLDDYLAEVRYVLIFAGLEFHVEIGPFGSKGADLGISRDGQSASVEVMRFRKVYPGPPILDLENDDLLLPEYGNPPRDIRKAAEKIQARFSQIGNEQAIIAIWNDEEELEELEVATAVNFMRQDAYRNVLALPDGLLFILYGSNAKHEGGQKQLYCFPLRYPIQSYQVAWQQELDSSLVYTLIRRALSA
jgi:hypothetical protein